MTDRLDAAIVAVRSDQEFIDELAEFVSIPSESIRKDNPHMQEAAEWLVSYLDSRLAAHTEVFSTEGNPIVFAELPSELPGVPTILVYGHYDVFEVANTDVWSTDPFILTRVGDSLHGRGTSDMKGQILAVLHAIEALQKTGPLPVNIKLLFEGNEETSPIVLYDFIPENRELLSCDISLNLDAGMMGEDCPTITYGLRGGLGIRIGLEGAERDLHSGQYGGVVDNPYHVAGRMIASLHDSDGRIAIPGFYDRVREISPGEHELLSKCPFGEDEIREQTGVAQSWGDSDFLPVERVGAQPCINVVYFEGSKAPGTIPSSTEFGLNIRLVSDMLPREVYNQLVEYLTYQVPETVRACFTEVFSFAPVVIDRESKYISALADALEKTWGREPIFTRSGGGIPVVEIIQDSLGVESALSGFGLPDAQVHGPNERVHLPTLKLGIEACIRYFLSFLTTAG